MGKYSFIRDLDCMAGLSSIDLPEYKIRFSTGVESLIRLWLLRLLVRLHAFNRCRSSYRDEELIYSLGEIFDIDMESCKTKDDDIDDKKVLKRLDKLYENTEKKLKPATAPRCLARNVERLSTLAGLSVTDCLILEFVVLVHTEVILEKTSELLGDLTSVQVFKTLSVVLDLPQAEIRNSLGKNSTLYRSGLVSLEQNGAVSLKDKLELLSFSFAENMVSLDADPVVLLRDVVFPSSPPHLAIDDFPHLAGELGALLPYLRKSLTTER